MNRLMTIFLLLLTLVSHGQQSQYIPTLFQPGTISTGDYDSHPAFSPDGTTLYFLRCTADINNSCTIMVSFMKEGKWTEPIVAPFSGQFYDIDPFVTVDGTWVYFCSNRPHSLESEINVETDIWRVRVHQNGWGEPERVNNINSDFDEYYPSLSSNGTIYFGSTRPGKGGSDIFSSKMENGKFQVVVNLGDSINTSNNEYEPFIAPDESYLIFMATKPTGLINADLFIAFRVNGTWGRPQKLPEKINSPFTEWSPKVSLDKSTLFFSSTRSIPRVESRPLTTQEIYQKLRSPGNGLGDIYFVSMDFLKSFKNVK